MGSPDSGRDLGRDTGAVGYTATIVAAKRGLEQHNPQPLVTDPYALALAGAESGHLLAKWEAVAQNQGITLAEVLAKRTRYVAVRTRFFDEAIQGFVRSVGAKALEPSAQVKAQIKPQVQAQVVILGAGLDTRALRLPELAEACCYEVDRPEVLAYKVQCLQTISPISLVSPLVTTQSVTAQSVTAQAIAAQSIAAQAIAAQSVTAPGRLYRIAADLAQPQDWLNALEEQGWSAQCPTFWVLEGVVMYLTAEEAGKLLRSLRESSSLGSVVGLDGVRSGSIRAAQDLQQQARGRVVRHWQFGHDRPQDWFQTCGWSAQIFRPSQLPWAKSRYPAQVPESSEMGGYDSERGVWLALADLDGA